MLGCFGPSQHDTEAVFCLPQIAQTPKGGCGIAVTPTTGTLNYTLVASDGTYTTTMNETWTVNNPITILAVAAQSQNATQAVSLQVQVSYTGSGTLTFSETGFPSGLSINSSTGLIAGTLEIGAGNRGAFKGTIVVTDGTFTISQNFETTITGDPSTTNSIEQPDDNDPDSVATSEAVRKLLRDSAILAKTAKEIDIQMSRTKGIPRDEANLTVGGYQLFLQIKDIPIDVMSEKQKADAVFGPQLKTGPTNEDKYAFLTSNVTTITGKTIPIYQVLQQKETDNFNRKEAKEAKFEEVRKDAALHTLKPSFPKLADLPGIHAVNTFLEKYEQAIPDVVEKGLDALDKKLLEDANKTVEAQGLGPVMKAGYRDSANGWAMVGAYNTNGKGYRVFSYVNPKFRLAMNVYVDPTIKVHLVKATGLLPVDIKVDSGGATLYFQLTLPK
jgi:hypothetical protein